MFKKTCLLFFLLLLPSVLFAARYLMPVKGNDVVGELITIQAEPGDTLDDIGDRYGIGWHEMIEANPTLSQDKLSGREEVIIPSQFLLPKYRKGIVINVAECRLYYFSPDNKFVYTYPVGLGRKGWRTPTTSTSIIRKTVNPTWVVPGTIREYVFQETGKWLPDVIPPGPENPLGPYAMYLGKSGYLIHGTNQPWSIGKMISAGCVRLNNQDVRELYQVVHNGTPVKIIHQPYKAGWKDGHLFLEAHIPVQSLEPPSDLNLISAEKCLLSATRGYQYIDWNNVRQILQQQHGIPEMVE